MLMRAAEAKERAAETMQLWRRAAKTGRMESVVKKEREEGT